MSLEKRTQLLDAAQKRFAYYGLSKVTMDEVAADVGLSKAAIYYYFKTKEEIFREVIVRELGQFIKELQAIVDENVAPERKIASYVRLRIQRFNELQNLKKVSSDFATELRAHLVESFREHGRHEKKLLAHILQQGKGTGELKLDSPAQTAELLQHLLQGLHLQRIRAALNQERGPHEPSARKSDSESRLLIHILLHGISKER